MSFDNVILEAGKLATKQTLEKSLNWLHHVIVFDLKNENFPMKVLDEPVQDSKEKYKI